MTSIMFLGSWIPSPSLCLPHLPLGHPLPLPVYVIEVSSPSHPGIAYAGVPPGRLRLLRLGGQRPVDQQQHQGHHHRHLQVGGRVESSSRQPSKSRRWNQLFRLYYLFQGQRTSRISEEALVRALLWLSPIISVTVTSLDAMENAIFYDRNPLLFGVRDTRNCDLFH